MKIRQTIFLLPLFLLAGCASAGGSQSRDLDLKELCTEEQVFRIRSPFKIRILENLLLCTEFL